MRIKVQLPNELYDAVEGADDGRIDFRIEEAISHALFALEAPDGVEIDIEWVD